jgi:hypothetical protein
MVAALITMHNKTLFEMVKQDRYVTVYASAGMKSVAMIRLHKKWR